MATTIEQTATTAWEIGYGYAVKGFCRHVPGKTWFENFRADFLEGFDAAVQAGQWNRYYKGEY